MAQVKKYLEGGKTSTSPDLIKVYGFEYEKGLFFNTLNNNANIDSYVYNSNMNEELASAFKDALSLYNKGLLTKNHPGVSYVDDYIKELMISPALNVYKKKPKQKITEGELFYKGFINKYYGGNKQLYRDDWYERGDETSRANRIADYLSSMNTEDIYNTFDFSESEFKDAASLKTAFDELAKDLRDGITDSDYDKANALGLNLKRWLQKPLELTTDKESENTKEKTAPTLEEKLEELKKQWRLEAIDKGLTADLVDDYVLMQVDAYNRTRDIMKLETDTALETEKIYKFLTDYYDVHESFGKNGLSRYKIEQDNVNDYLFLNGSTVSDFLTRANKIINQAKTGSYTGLLNLGKGNTFVLPSSTLKQVIEEGYPKVKEKLLRIYKGSTTTKLTDSDIALLKIANTSNYIPISGYKNNFLNVICFNLSNMTFIRVPLFSHHLLKILDSPDYPSNSDEKIVLNRVLKAFNNYIATNYSNINADNLRRALRNYEKYRSLYANTPGNNPWGTNAQDFINKDFLERTRSTTLDEIQLVESQKHGGVLSYLAGGIVDALNNKIEAKKALERKENEILREKTGLTKEQYKYRYEDVVKFGFGTDGFRSEDWWRLGALAGDLIGLAASFIPGYGTVAAAGLGVGSVIADSVADFKDPSVSAGDAWLNILKNVGISLVGLLPGGRTGSVTAKLVRNFPRVIGVLNAADAGPDIIKSYIKLVNGEDMTRLDWSNIWDGGRILLAGSREAKAFKTGKKYLTENTENSFVTVKTTNNRTIQLTGKEATEYRKLRTIDEKNTFLKNLNGDRKLAADESIKMTHWNSKVPSASALPAERVTRGEYRFMTPEEVSEKYNGFIPRSYSRFYKSMQFYLNIGSSSLGKYAASSDGSLPDRTGNIFNRAYSYDHFAEKFNLASNVAGKNAAKRVAKQIKSKKLAEGITPELTVENTTQPSVDAAVTTPSTSSPAPATGAVAAPVAPEVARSPQKPKPVIIDNRKFKQNDKGNWLELINGRWKRSDPPSNSQIQFDFKIGGKLQKYILKAAGGTPINGPWIWGLDENNYWFSGENNPKNSKYDFNKAKEFYNNYFLSKTYTSDVNKVYDDWKKKYPGKSLEDFTKYYNDHIDTLRAFMKGRKNVQWNSQNDSIGNFNTYFHELFPSYGGGVDYNPILVNTAAGRTQARIAPSFSNNDGSLDYRKGTIRENDSDVRYYLDDEGKIHFLSAGLDYPTSLTSDTSNNSNLYGPSEPWGTDYSAWSSNPDNLSSWINEILNGTRDSEGNVIKKGILGNLPDLNNNLSYDLSVPMEMAKLLNTFITNKTVTDKAMDISVPLDNYYHENSIQNDIYGSTKYYEELATSLLLNAYKLASTATSPEQALAIMLNAYREASKLRQLAGLVAGLLIEKNLKSAVDTANTNLKNDIAVANENNRKIAAVNEAKKNIEIESLKSNSANFLTGLDWFMDRYNKARALKNTALALKLALDLGLYYSDARVKLANAYNMHIRQAYNNWLKNNPLGKYDDFVKEWNETHKRVWDEAFRQLQSWTDRMYTDALYLSSSNPGQVTVGIDTSVSTPPYRSLNIYLPGYKKGGSMTLEERMDLENAENLLNLNKMSIKNNARRNLLKERHELRLSSQASKNISLLINRALGV